MSLLPLVIVNPASARGATGRQWPSIASDLRTHFGPFNCAFTERAGDGRRLASEAAAQGRRLIVACGGDGTINEVANGILEAGGESELGLLPSGTGGDFRRTLRIPARAAEAARSLREGRTRQMDAGRVTYINHAGESETRYFLGVASFGMSPEVIERVKKSDAGWLSSVRAGRQGSLGGRVSFALATLQTTLTSPRTSVTVQLDAEAERRLTLTNLCVANARYFGGGMKVAPQAILDDGRFDVIIIGDLGALKILGHAPQLYLGTHLRLDQVHHRRAARVEARPADKKREVAIEVDGELVGRLPATFEILPGALRVRS
ncbi:MAG TPA: diacylglycerol kinase family protein [Pyrinomonadaceae bacterium]